MVLKIEEHSEGPRTTFVLSGRIESSNVQQLKSEIDRIETDVALDLRQVLIVDREAVCFLARCETRGIELVECPPFVRAWIKSEQNSK
jgi:ABC-type transporter Mla MlaB component